MFTNIYYYIKITYVKKHWSVCKDAYKKLLTKYTEMSFSYKLLLFWIMEFYRMDTLSSSVRTVNKTCGRKNQIPLGVCVQYRFCIRIHLHLRLLQNIQWMSNIYTITTILFCLPERPSFVLISVLHVKHIFIRLPHATNIQSLTLVLLTFM